MAVKRIVDTSFWGDAKVIDMYSTEDRYFMLYFMTNPQSTQLGIYPLPIRIASFQTGHSPESTKEIINRFTSRHKTILYDWFTQEISLIDSLKYSVIKGGKPVEDLLVKEIGRVQSDNLVVLTYEHMLSFWNKSDRIFDKTIKQIFEHELEKRKNIISNANDNDNDNEESYHESYHESSEKTAVVDAKKDLNYKSVYDHYIKLGLVKHRTFTDDMKKAISSAMKNNKYTIEYCMTLLDRHKQIVEITKGDGQYSVRPRPLEQFFGQKAFNAKHLICSEYDEGGDKYLKLQEMPKEKTDTHASILARMMEEQELE